MPTTRTKRQRHRAGALDHWKLGQLVTGDCLLAGVGYAELAANGCNHWTDAERAAVHDAMRTDWAVHSPAVMAWWRGETEQFTRIGLVDDMRAALRDRLAYRGRTEPWAAVAFAEGAQ